jgi:hypothetical protein
MFNRTTKPVTPTFKSEVVNKKTLTYTKPLSLEQEAQIYKATGKLPKYELDAEPKKPEPEIVRAPQPTPVTPKQDVLPLGVKDEVKKEEAVSVPVKKKKQPVRRNKTLEPYYGWTVKGVELSTRRIVEIASRKEGMKQGAWCNIILKRAGDAVISGETMPVSKKELIDEVKEEIEQLKAEIPKIVKRALHESIKNKTLTQKRKSLWQRIMNG